MTETEFNQAVDAILAQIETALDACDSDIDYETTAGILTLEFEDGSKIIINRQTPNREIWVAAKAGGFHYRRENGAWVNTRDGSELMHTLSQLISQQSGSAFSLI